ncbi:MAG TPA: class I SAM-dependent methyltransferase [Candidatus Binataceae bacterium]|nr:class I SAM-dependent methyltransferase [Candidatus Binataceae bacterium]
MISIRTTIICAVALGFSLAMMNNRNQAVAQPNPALMAKIAESAPIPSEQIPAPVKAAVAASDRPAQDRELDTGRKPEQMLAFFGIGPGMKVADLFAGGGYTTELLSRVVGPDGKVYSQNPDFPEKYKKIGEAWEQRLKEPALSNVVAIRKPFSADDLLPVPPGSLDAVVMNMNYHDLVGMGVDREKVDREVFAALKSGGVFGIIDHSAKPGTGVSESTTIHRIDQSTVESEIEQAGFKLAAASSALRNPSDPRTEGPFKHRGQTDRFMLKFVKP